MRARASETGGRVSESLPISLHGSFRGNGRHRAEVTSMLHNSLAKMSSPPLEHQLPRSIRCRVHSRKTFDPVRSLNSMHFGSIPVYIIRMNRRFDIASLERRYFSRLVDSPPIRPVTSERVPCSPRE